MSLLKSDDFIADVEHQFEWYAINAGLAVAEGYLEAVKATCQLLAQYPHLGPQGGFAHPRLREWRFFIVFRPFNKHVLFYEVVGADIVMRRAMHGHRNHTGTVASSARGSVNRIPLRAGAGSANRQPTNSKNRCCRPSPEPYNVAPMTH